MSVITISRQAGSGGDDVANRVCQLLGYRHFDKGLVARAARESGLSDHEVVDFSEENYQVRSFLDRLFGRKTSVAQVRVWKEDVSGARTTEEIALSEEAAVSLMQKAIQAACDIGQIVIVGRGGQALLKDRPNVLNVRIVAPMEDRIQRIKEQLKHERQSFQADIDIRREAQDYITSHDAASADYLKRFYGIDWDDPTLYHLVLNTGRFGIEQTAQLIVEVFQKYQLQTETEAVVNG
jgi:cytidylate kinase